MWEASGFRIWGTADRDEMEKRVMDALRATFKPEFLNRIDEIVIFNSLGPEEIKKIVGIQMKLLSKRLEASKITLELTDNAEEFLANTGFDPVYGARPSEEDHPAPDTGPFGSENPGGFCQGGGSCRGGRTGWRGGVSINLTSGWASRPPHPAKKSCINLDSSKHPLSEPGAMGISFRTIVSSFVLIQFDSTHHRSYGLKIIQLKKTVPSIS